MTGTERRRAFAEFAAAAAAGPGTATVIASCPPGIPREGAVLPELQAACRALARLDALSPLERNPGGGVWETLAARFQAGRSPVLMVRNMAGEREVVTSFARGGVDSGFEDWCRCREESVDLGTPWDLARSRRLLGWSNWPGRGSRALIDRGANFVVEALNAAGCETRYSCEGHPRGAYVVFDGPGREAAVNEFRRLGWRMDSLPGGAAVARMRRVRDVHERDGQWRRLALGFRVGPVPADGTDAEGPASPHSFVSLSTNL